MMSFRFTPLRLGPMFAVLFVVVAAYHSEHAVVAAQEQRSVNGRVIDRTGAALPGVIILVSSTEGGGRRAQLVTDGEGRFTLPTLAPGRYRLEAQLAGFAPAVLESVDVPAGNGALELVLQPAS